MPTSKPNTPLTFKLRPEERDRLREVAENARVGPSTLVAEVVRAAIGTARRRPIPRQLDDLAEAVRIATGHLGKIGNNLNQLARASNGGIPADGDALAAIRASLAAIDAHLASALNG